jgi:hypothetical protein
MTGAAAAAYGWCSSSSSCSKRLLLLSGTQHNGILFRGASIRDNAGYRKSRWCCSIQALDGSAASHARRTHGRSAIFGRICPRAASAPSGDTPWPSASLTAVQGIISAHYLPIALLCALLLGAAWPAAGVAASALHIPAIVTFCIFVLQVSE